MVYFFLAEMLSDRHLLALELRCYEVVMLGLEERVAGHSLLSFGLGIFDSLFVFIEFVLVVFLA